MKINWFSPLSPAKTAIADDLMFLITYLHKKAEIILWTNQSIWDKKLEEYASIRQYQINQISWFEINQADINIYHLANNAIFHKEIWQISQQSPGLVILHDYKLQDFFYMLYQDKQDYIRQMKSIYGEEGEKKARLFCKGYISMKFMAENYPLTELALKNSLGVIIHNREVYNWLTEKNQWLTGYTPLPYISTNISSEFRQKKSSSPYNLIIFGFIGKNRCIDTFLKALSQLSSKNCFRLNIYGELWDRKYINDQIQKLDLQNIVTIHGFVSDSELDEALSNADLAINLRYPTMGEASGSQLRIWNHSLPSLVTKIDWYGKLNPKAVGFVRHNHEIEDIQQHLQKFLNDPEFYRKMGQKGKTILEKDHNPDLYSQAIVDFAKEVSHYRCNSTSDRIISRISRELPYYPPSSIANSNLTRISEIIKFISY